MPGLVDSDTLATGGGVGVAGGGTVVAGTGVANRLLLNGCLVVVRIGVAPNTTPRTLCIASV